MLNEKQLKHLADLAKIELSAEERDKLGADINNILAYVEQIKALDLDKLEKDLPAEALMAGGCPLREDRPQPCDSAIIAQIIENFPEREGNYLKVPKVIEK